MHTVWAENRTPRGANSEAVRSALITDGAANREIISALGYQLFRCRWKQLPEVGDMFVRWLVLNVWIFNEIKMK